MKRTGLYQHVRELPDSEIATGYGFKSVGTINSPKYWGKTSWLAMGAGSMVSTPGDLYKWATAMREGKLISKAGQRRILSHGTKIGGNERGFLCACTYGPRNMMFFSSNAYGASNGKAESLAKALAKLVSSG